MICSRESTRLFAGGTCCLWDTLYLSSQFSGLTNGFMTVTCLDFTVWTVKISSQFPQLLSCRPLHDVYGAHSTG